MAAPRPPRPVCEVDRAFLELVGRPRSETSAASSVCSPEPPELRPFPVPRVGAREYILCNGHITDLFDELARAKGPRPTVGTDAPTG